MERIETLEQLAERYGAPMERAVTKEQPALTPPVSTLDSRMPLLRADDSGA